MKGTISVSNACVSRELNFAPYVYEGLECYGNPHLNEDAMTRHKGLFIDLAYNCTIWLDDEAAMCLYDAIREYALKIEELAKKTK